MQLALLLVLTWGSLKGTTVENNSVRCLGFEVRLSCTIMHESKSCSYDARKACNHSSVRTTVVDMMIVGCMGAD